MRKELMTQYGFDVLVADGLDPVILKLSHDVIPAPSAGDTIRFGSAFCLVKDGVANMHVLVGSEEHLRIKSSHAWRRLGLRPISVTSEFGQSVSGKKVGDVIDNGQGLHYRIVDIFSPDVSRSTPYEPPEKVTHFKKRCA